tara:strand:+ start:192 stop:464 length:273 start_codon:yes stop_codon:yes gene_type:complete
MKERIDIIKENMFFNELPKDIQKAYINNLADDMILQFDEGVYNKRTATIDAKKYFYDWNKHIKWILYKSSYHGIKAERQEDFNEHQEDYA